MPEEVTAKTPTFPMISDPTRTDGQVICDKILVRRYPPKALTDKLWTPDNTREVQGLAVVVGIGNEASSHGLEIGRTVLLIPSGEYNQPAFGGWKHEGVTEFALVNIKDISYQYPKDA